MNACTYLIIYLFIYLTEFVVDNFLEVWDLQEKNVYGSISV